MSVIDLKCNNCGSSLSKIENEKNTYICLHCGSKQIIKSDEYKISNNYQINQNIVKNIYGSEKEEYIELIQKGETYLKLKEYKKALEYFKRATDENPSNYYGWWMLAKTKIIKKIEAINKFFLNFENTNSFSSKVFKKEYENALKLANEQEKQQIINEFQALTKDFEIYNDDSKTEDNIDAVFGNGKDYGSVQYVGGFTLLFLAIGMLVVALLVEKAFLAYTIILFLISLIIFSLTSQRVKLLKYIKTKEKLSLKEMMAYMRADYYDEYAQERFLRLLRMLIEEEYLCNYKYENEMLIRVSKNN